MIGQQSVKESPYITNYIVIDEKDETVDLPIAQEVYFIVMIAIITKELQSLNKIFETQRHLSKGHAVTYKKFGMGQVTEEIVFLWDNLFQSLVALENKKRWLEEDWEDINKKWAAFWKAYEGRASLLMPLPWHKVSEEDDDHNLYNYILLEAQKVAMIFRIKRLDIKEDPLNWKSWLYFNGEQAFAKDRDRIISTEAERRSQQIMVWTFYILVLGIITPFFTLRIFQDGFAYLFIIIVFYTIYFALYYTNAYRLRQSMYVRLKDEWHEGDKPIFYAKAMSVNMAASAFYVVIATVTMFVYSLYQFGWNGMTLFYFILMTFTLVFTFWFPYSPFVEKNVSFFPDKIRAGHREFYVPDIRKISVNKHKISYNLYLTYTSEPYEVYIEKGYRKQTLKVMTDWCEKHQISFTLFNKQDREKGWF